MSEPNDTTPETPTATGRCYSSVEEMREQTERHVASQLAQARQEIAEHVSNVGYLAAQLAQAQQTIAKMRHGQQFTRGERENEREDNAHEMERVKEQLAQARQEALRLADCIYRQEYATEAPDWRPCPDVAGIISQIDNMHAGVRNQRDTLRAALAKHQQEGESK